MKKLPLLLLVTIAAIVSAGCNRNKEYRHLEGSVWNTLYHITYRADRSLDDSIQLIFRQVENSLSPFIPSSTISLINRNESTQTDSLIRRVFHKSLLINHLSNGLFDPTVSPLINLWGFGYTKNDSLTPTPDNIKQALTHVGINQCSISADLKIVKKSPSTEFNFSAITKGMGCDLIAEMFKRNNIDNYLIEIGGEIAMNGLNSRNLPWNIQIDKPIFSDTTIISIPLAVIAPGNCGIATSGNYRNFKRDANGRPSFGHTISPLSGYPIKSATASATVIAPDCMTADALATACMAMDPDSALSMINRIPNTHLLLVCLLNDSLVVRQTPRFPIP